MAGPNATKLISRLFVMISAVLAVAALYLAKVVFLPLAFAILFAFLVAPLISWLERIHVPRTFAVVLVIAGFASILGGVGWIAGSQLIQMAADLPNYQQNIDRKFALIHHGRNTSFSRAEAEVNRLRQRLEEAAPGNDQDAGTLRQHPVQVRDVAQTKGRLDQVGGIVDPMVTVFLTIVFTFFVLLRREDLRNRLIGLAGRGHVQVTTLAMMDAAARISRYFQLQLAVNTSYGAIVVLALFLIGVPHFVLFGALALVLRFIPYIGAPISALLPATLAFAVFPGWTPGLLVLAVFFCLEVVTANYAEPHLYGRQTGLSSLAILVAAGFWTLIWGPVGLVLSVPLTVCLVVIGSHVPNFEFLTVMLGDQPPIPPSAQLFHRLLARDEREAAEILENSLVDHTLEQVYDDVVLPALSMAERNRHQQDLDEDTEQFMYRTLRDLILDMSDREQSETASQAQSVRAAPTKILCVPVRDEADDIAGIMLAQLLQNAGFEAKAIHLEPDRRLGRIAAEEQPEIVFLSGLAPFARGRSRRVYNAVRSRYPKLRIMIGLWNYGDDQAQAAQQISRGEVSEAAISMAQAVAQVQAAVAQGGGTPTVDQRQDVMQEMPAR
ncbi:MAG TPA: AI-2E family transporter [Acidobacteriaceae bacterium]|nr:AI-2E family transporter [Acidobacteriaceae bacterium]